VGYKLWLNERLSAAKPRRKNSKVQERIFKLKGNYRTIMKLSDKQIVRKTAYKLTPNYQVQNKCTSHKRDYQTQSKLSSSIETIKLKRNLQAQRRLSTHSSTSIFSTLLKLLTFPQPPTHKAPHQQHQKPSHYQHLTSDTFS
jgi:hypothetical protein